MRLFIVLSSFVLGVSVAQAQAPGDEPPPPEPEPEPAPMPAEPMPPPPPPGPVVAPVVVQPPPPVSTVDEGVIEDANSGRNWLSPTALTPPAGTWTFSDFQLFVVSGGYAPSDQVYVSATTLLPIVDGMPFFGMLTGKFQVLRSGRLRAAAQLSGIYASVETTTFDSMGNESSRSEGAFAAILGGALTLCLDDACHSHLTGYLGAGFAQEDQSAVPFVASVALVQRLGRRVKLMLEADTGFVLGEIDAAADGFLAWYGARFTSQSIGVDLGFAKPICDGCGDIGLPMGFPFIGFTYRSFKE